MPPSRHCRRVCVLVGGDLGRSPRMQYQALSLASAGITVDLIGYQGEQPRQDLLTHKSIRVSEIRAPEPGGSLVARGFAAALRTARLAHRLARTKRPDCVLVQTPPAIPALLIAVIAARFWRCRLVVDWHNWSHAMLALRLGPKSFGVRLLERWEGALGRCADASLCVSAAMARELANRWGLAGVAVLPDAPAPDFRSTPLELRAPLFERLNRELDLPPEGGLGRAPLLVSATSWTRDEDFGILLDALVEFDREGAGPVVVLITGKGPLRESFEERVRHLDLRRVFVRTTWLSAEEYPLLLGAADLGLCLHRSASGVDLPMKVLDMFGSGLPVCALDYPCLRDELVRHGENGLVFSSAPELAQQLRELLADFPENRRLRELTRHVRANPRPAWVEVWRKVALPLLATDTAP